jgi:hypothetical protein
MKLLSCGDQLSPKPLEAAAHAGVETMGTNL